MDPLRRISTATCHSILKTYSVHIRDTVAYSVDNEVITTGKTEDSG
ncbi:MAG: hypothetical protein ACLTW9_02040 [Enterocloster sp.]